MRRTGTAALALAFAAGCGGAAATGGSSSSTPAISHAPLAERLVVEGDVATTVIDTGTGRAVASLPGGVLSPSGDLLVHVAAAQGKTAVSAVDLAGNTVMTLALAGEYAVPNAYGAAPSGFSPNGTWLVLVSRDASESRFAVIDVAHRALATTVTLGSRFTFDAIHDGGGAMYLIEHPTPSSTAYNVRFYDLNAKVLKPDIVFDKTAIGQFDPTRGLMDGTFHVAVAPKASEWTYGLYMRPSGAPFVHALNVPGRFAQCIVDLTGKWTASSMFSMALSDDARSLYVVDAGGGSVNVIDALTQKVARRATFGARPAAGEPRTASAVISHDGSRLYATGSRGIAMLQTNDLALRGWLAPDVGARSLAIASDNARLYALAGDDVIVIDIASGRVVGTLASIPHARGIRLLPAGAASRS